MPYFLSSKELIDAKLGSVTTVPETVFVDANGKQGGEPYRGDMQVLEQRTAFKGGDRQGGEPYTLRAAFVRKIA